MINDDNSQFSLSESIIGEYLQMYPEKRKQDILNTKCFMKLNDKNYRVTAVGRVATANLRQRGHITLNFDGADIAELPGTVHLYGEPPQIIQPGDQISFYPNCH